MLGLRWLSRKRSLFEQATGEDALFAAWKRVRENRAGPGHDGTTLAQFEANLQANFRTLSEELREGRYAPQPLQEFALPKSDGTSRRVGVVSVRDRVAQRAVYDALEPVFERVFLPCSYGYRPGRSAAQAIAHVLRDVAEGHPWVGTADVADCFDSLDRRMLLDELQARAADARLAALVEQWLPPAGAAARPEAARPREAAALLDRARRTGWEIVQAAWQRDSDEPTTMALAMRVLADGGRLVRRVWPEVRPDPAAVLRRVRLNRRVAVSIAAAALAAGLAGARRLAPRRPVEGRGTPQGMVISPLLANVYLHRLDAAMAGLGYRYVRYADNIAVAARSRDEAREALAAAEAVLRDLRLRLNPRKTRIAHIRDGVEFLGTRLTDRGAAR